MKQIINIISNKRDSAVQQDVICNYGDNYYGDQVCVPVTVKSAKG